MIDHGYEVKRKLFLSTSKDYMKNEEGMEEGGENPEGFKRERGGFGVKSSYFLPKPVKVGDEVEVKIEAMARRGDGIAKKDGFVIFVKGAKEGDTVKVRITDVRPRFAVGEIIS
jgi:predicted RNA-binding protein with TRAM domain